MKYTGAHEKDFTARGFYATLAFTLTASRFARQTAAYLRPG
jgi:hypothetical protein